jgi:hypothetical protein
MTAIYTIGATKYGSLAEALRTGKSGISVSDTAQAIATAISTRTFLDANSRISSISANDGLGVAVDIDKLANNKAVLLKLSATTKLDVKGTIADLGSNFTSLDAVYSKIKSIKATDDLTAQDGTGIIDTTKYINVSYNDYKASKNAAGVQKIINTSNQAVDPANDPVVTGEKINVTGFSGSNKSLASLINDDAVASITINDSVANLTQNASLIMGSAKIAGGAGKGVAVTDTLKNVNTDAAKRLLGTVLYSKWNTSAESIKVTLNAKELTEDKTVNGVTTLGTISQLNATSGEVGSAMTSIRAKLSLIISGTAADISANAKGLTAALNTVAPNASAIAAKIKTIKVADGTLAKPATMTMTDEQHTAIEAMINSNNEITNAGKYNYKLTDVSIASAGTGAQADPLVVSYKIKDTGANALGANDLLTVITDKVTAMNISDTLVSDINTLATGINAKFGALTDVQKAKVSVAVSDSVSNITGGTTLSYLTGKSYVKSINATTGNVADLTTPSGTNNIDIVKNKSITSIDVHNASRATVQAYLNANKRPTKVTFSPV